jgi:hypothetical protein
LLKKINTRGCIAPHLPFFTTIVAKKYTRGHRAPLSPLVLAIITKEKHKEWHCKPPFPLVVTIAAKK